MPDSPPSPRLVVRCWGARGTVPSPGAATLRYGGHTTCVELTTPDGQRAVLDAGSGIRPLALDWKTHRPLAPAADISLFLTHRHFDHVIGLPHFLPLLANDTRVEVRCGNAGVDELAHTLDTLLKPPLFVATPERATLALESCDVGISTQIGAGCRVTPFEARHNGGAAIFLVERDSRPVFAFAPDNELSYASDDRSVASWRGALAARLHGVDVLMHDAMFTDDELPRYVGWGHSSADEATRFAIECGASTLVLCHHHPDRADGAVDAMTRRCRELARARGSALGVEAAYEGMTLAL